MWLYFSRRDRSYDTRKTGKAMNRIQIIFWIVFTVETESKYKCLNIDKLDSSSLKLVLLQSLGRNGSIRDCQSNANRTFINYRSILR